MGAGFSAAGGALGGAFFAGRVVVAGRAALAGRSAFAGLAASVGLVAFAGLAASVGLAAFAGLAASAGLAAFGLAASEGLAVLALFTRSAAFAAAVGSAFAGPDCSAGVARGGVLFAGGGATAGSDRAVFALVVVRSGVARSVGVAAFAGLRGDGWRRAAGGGSGAVPRSGAVRVPEAFFRARLAGASDEPDPDGAEASGRVGRPSVVSGRDDGEDAEGGWKVTGGAALGARRLLRSAGLSCGVGWSGVRKAASAERLRGSVSSIRGSLTAGGRFHPLRTAPPTGHPLCPARRGSGILGVRRLRAAGETSPSLVYGAALLMRLGFYRPSRVRIPESPLAGHRRMPARKGRPGHHARVGSRLGKRQPVVTAPVAQWIEHLTTDQKVRGSSPFGRATLMGP